MLFSEIYSTYYHAVARIIDAAIAGEINEKRAAEIINDTAFSESFFYIQSAIRNEDWQILTKEYKTPIKNRPKMPLSTLQKRWLKTISEDKRIKLFVDQIDGLDDIMPLYKQSDLHYFDMINDGDDYENPQYIKTFRTILTSIRESRKLKIEYESGKGKIHSNIYIPYELEYSQKDDKFRLITYGSRDYFTLNLGRIKSCELMDVFVKERLNPIVKRKEKILIELIDDRNALERVLLHFASFEKITAQISERTYRMELTYNKDDETEILIRILSFGPMVKVLSPDSFIDLIRERLNMQKNIAKDLC